MKTKTVDDKYVCVLCNRFLFGLCYKRLLVFVKENIPDKMPYTVSETVPSFFYLANSTTQGAGKGLFTKIDLPCRIVFGSYSGELTWNNSGEITDYSWQVVYEGDKKTSVDAGSKNYSNWMRYVNCARIEQEQNLIALIYYQKAYYYSYKPIPANTELMVWYGREYAEQLQIPRADKTSGLKASRKR